MDRIVFLGSGGGGLMVASQTRKTGGLYFEFGLGEESNFTFCLDPGPGSLVHAIALGLHPEKWNGIVVSHHHLDAVNDANVIIDAMSSNKEQKQTTFPFLIAEEHCIKQGRPADPYPYITKYHQGLVKKLFPVAAGSHVQIGNLEIRAVKALHYTYTLGYVLSYDNFKIGYPADGSYYAGQEKSYESCDLLILNVPWPKGHAAPKGIHMTLDDAISLVKNMGKKPRLSVLTHLSPFILRANMYKQERIFQEATKSRCISASDFMELNLDTLKTRILAPVVKL